MEASVHIIHGESNRLSNFRIVMRDAGFDIQMNLVFSGLASAYGVLTEEEQEHGVLLVDIGAGTTEYIVVFNQGVLASGVIPIGFDHVANDLSIGLDLSIHNCRKMLNDGTITNHLKERYGNIEVRSNNGNARKIPMSSVEKIIDMRLKEIFQVIHNKVKDLALLNNLSAGGIISGGAALFPRTSEIYRTTFDFPVRIGQPFEAAGAVTGIEDPRYSNVWGALRFGLASLISSAEQEKGGLIRIVISHIDRIADSMMKRFRDVKDAIKI
jgi:cell division protein FtsA